MTTAWPLLLAGSAAVPRSQPRVRERIENGAFTAFEAPGPVGWDVEAGRVRPEGLDGEQALALVPADGEAALVQRVGADAEAAPVVPGVRHLLTVDAALREPPGTGGAEARVSIVWRNPLGQTLEDETVPLGTGRVRRELTAPDGAAQAEVRLVLSTPRSDPATALLLVREVSFGPWSA